MFSIDAISEDPGSLADLIDSMSIEMEMVGKKKNKRVRETLMDGEEDEDPEIRRSTRLQRV